MKKFTRKRVVVTSNTDWSLLNYRGNLLRTCLAEDCDVYTFSKHTGYESELKKLKVKPINIFLKQKSKNPLFEILSIVHFYFWLVKIRPDYVFSFTIKPNLYVGLTKSFSFLKFYFVPNITGLGGQINTANSGSSIFLKMYTLAFRKVNLVFTQNNEDLEFLVKNIALKREQCKRLMGSGVDLQKFHSIREVGIGQKPKIHVGFISRLLKSKGVVQLIEATKLFKETIHLHIAGGFDDANNSDSLTPEELNHLLEGADNITFHGFMNDIKILMKEIDVACLPSVYNEGVPRSLLEGLAGGKAIITTNHKGCKETVRHLDNGYLLPTNEFSDIVNALKYISENKESLPAFGQNSFALAREKFNEKDVLKHYQELLKK